MVQHVTAQHLTRLACLYVRQSTLQQVMENTESTCRQYALRERARALGWAEERIVVIDQDLGHSGASTADRLGFQRLVAEIGLGHVGLVLGLEVSGLARNSSDWHQLLEVDRLERAYQVMPKPAALTLSVEQREQIRALAQDLPALWDAPTTTFAQRKQLLRWLIKDITLSKRDQRIVIDIRWQTEAQTHLSIPRLKKSWEVRQTDQQVIGRVRELAPTHTASQIANLPNEEGLHAGMGGSFTASKVDWIRAAYHIPLACPEGPGFCPTGQRGDGRYCALAAAELLNVNVSTIADWCNAGILESVRAHPHGPRWITLTPDIIAQLRKPTQRHWKRRRSGKPRQNVVE